MKYKKSRSFAEWKKEVLEERLEDLFLKFEQKGSFIPSRSLDQQRVYDELLRDENAKLFTKFAIAYVVKLCALISVLYDFSLRCPGENYFNLHEIKELYPYDSRCDFLNNLNSLIKYKILKYKKGSRGYFFSDPGISMVRCPKRG